MPTRAPFRESPESLPALREAIADFWSQFSEMVDSQGTPNILRVRRQQSALVLQANLRELERVELRVSVGDDDLSFRWHTLSYLISLTSFRIKARHRRDCLTIRFEPRQRENNWATLREKLSDPIRLETFVQIAQQASQPARSIFIQRALNALLELSSKTPTASLEAAATASTDVQVLFRALQEPSVLGYLTDQNPLAASRLRGITSSRHLLEAHGHPLSSTEVAGLLGLSRQAVNKRRRSNKLLALSLGAKSFVYPSWQFSEEGTIPDLERTLRALEGHDDWMKLAFMVNPNSLLDNQPPFQALKEGKSASVVRAARLYGTHGAN